MTLVIPLRTLEDFHVGFVDHLYCAVSTRTQLSMYIPTHVYGYMMTIVYYREENIELFCSVFESLARPTEIKPPPDVHRDR